MIPDAPLDPVSLEPVVELHRVLTGWDAPETEPGWLSDRVLGLIDRGDKLELAPPAPLTIEQLAETVGRLVKLEAERAELLERSVRARALADVYRLVQRAEPDEASVPYFVGMPVLIDDGVPPGQVRFCGPDGRAETIVQFVGDQVYVVDAPVPFTVRESMFVRDA